MFVAGVVRFCCMTCLARCVFCDVFVLCDSVVCVLCRVCIVLVMSVVC